MSLRLVLAAVIFVTALALSLVVLLRATSEHSTETVNVRRTAASTYRLFVPRWPPGEEAFRQLDRFREPRVRSRADSLIHG